jgi:hypothetical protein
MKKHNRTKLLDRSYNIRDAQLFVIATEGAKTEKCYFNFFKDSRIHIEVIETGEKNDSAPQHVLNRLNDFAQKYDFGEEDQLWLVLDVDRWPKQNLKQVCSESIQKKYRLAISNPCFEVWLWLHLDDLSPNNRTCDDFEKALRSTLGSYNSSNLNRDHFFPYIQDAINRAKMLHPNTQEYWPSTIGSHVYRVVEQICQAININ